MPTVPKLEWAEEQFYPADGSGNPWRTGTSPTKVEPPGGIIATGVVPDTPVAAQWENYWKNRVAALSKKALVDIAGRFVRLGSFTTAADNDIGVQVIATRDNVPVLLGPPAWCTLAKRFIAGNLTDYQHLDARLNSTAAIAAGTSCPGYNRVLSTWDPWEHNQDPRTTPVVHVLSTTGGTAGFFTVSGYTADTSFLQAGVTGVGGPLGDAQICEYNTAGQKGFLAGAMTNGGVDACIIPRNNDTNTATSWGLFGTGFGGAGKFARSWFWVPNASGTARLHYYFSADGSRVEYVQYTGGLSTARLIDTAFLPSYANEFLCHPWADTVDSKVRYAKSILNPTNPYWMARSAFHTYIFENDFSAYQSPTPGVFATPALVSEVEGVSIVNTFRYTENIIYATGVTWAGSTSQAQANIYVSVDGGLAWNDTGTVIGSGTAGYLVSTNFANAVTWSRSPMGVVCSLKRPSLPQVYWVCAGGVLDYYATSALTL